MNKIYILSDPHGSYTPFKNLRETIGDEPATVIVTGDFGANYWLNKKDKKLKEKLGEFNFTYFIVRGNHEERPSICMQNHPNFWRIETFWNNQVYVEHDYPYIKYALDIPTKYEIPTAQGLLIQTLVLPGAYSADKFYRIENNMNWFSQEQCTDEERKLGLKFAVSQDWDLILSHTCPVLYEPTDLFLPMIDQNSVDKTTERWLGEIEHKMAYRLWVWGHFHENRIYPKFNKSERVMMFNDCAFDIYKYFCGNYKTINCLIKTTPYTFINNLDF